MKGRKTLNWSELIPGHYYIFESKLEQVGPNGDGLLKMPENIEEQTEEHFKAINLEEPVYCYFPKNGKYYEISEAEVLVRII